MNNSPRLNNVPLNFQHFDYKEFKLFLLNMWKQCGIGEIYKYKNRIKAFREPLINIELFYDLTYTLFMELTDLASVPYDEDSYPEKFAVSVDSLISKLKGE